MIKNPPAINGDYNRDPCTKALKRMVFVNQGSTLTLSMLVGA